jgi:hypothetical protein
LSEAKFVKILQIEPEFRRGAKEMGKPQRRITSDRALSVQNLGNPVGGHAEIARPFRGAHVQRLELFRQMFAGMNRDNCHCHLQVIINDLDIRRAG